jgi:hypothetical protein
VPKGVYERESLESRFWKRVQKSEGCWAWGGFVATNGYGQVTVNGKPALAHRVSYEINRGPIPAGLHVRHTCDNRKCVNPAHLELGTHADNMQDRKKAGRYGGAYCGARIPVDVVTYIRALREAGFSCRRLAEHFGVSKSQIKNIVSGRQRVAA